jgi:hypothetical protein
MLSKLGQTPPLDGKASGDPVVPTTAAGSVDHHYDDTWMALCGQAAVEQDPKRLLHLVREINRLLEVRKQRLSGPSVNQPSSLSAQLKDDKK